MKWLAVRASTHLLNHVWLKMDEDRARTVLPSARFREGRVERVVAFCNGFVAGYLAVLYRRAGIICTTKLGEEPQEHQLRLAAHSNSALPPPSNLTANQNPLNLSLEAPVWPLSLMAVLCPHTTQGRSDAASTPQPRTINPSVEQLDTQTWASSLQVVWRPARRNSTVLPPPGKKNRTTRITGASDPILPNYNAITRCTQQ